MLRLLSGFSVFSAICSLSISAYAAAGCESWSAGHTIAAITEDASKIQLDDGTNWRVEEADTDTVENWKISAPIEICDDRKLTNTDEKESVYAKQLK